MMGICVFFLCMALLVAGYVLYSRFVERVYDFNTGMEMPCVQSPDGVDYVPLPFWKIFLIQLLNIAGLGPVVGAISGCLFGPVALLWIVLGCIFAGAMHDFLAAAMSAEQDGANLPELLGTHLGDVARYAMRFISIFLLLMVGVVFTMLPAGMLGGIFSSVSPLVWSIIILAYYFMATILPVQVIIGRLYPVFGAVFLFMAVGMGIMLPLRGYEVLPDLDFFRNNHPAGISVWPMLFVTIACGAISGFHATQSPMMVRCCQRGGDVRRVFYGAMVVEGVVALIWAVVGLSLREVMLADGCTLGELILKDPSSAVLSSCDLLLGNVGGMIAVLGVVVLAITSGDTAMRSCRLMLADVVRVKQTKAISRLALAVPLFLVVIYISQIDFSTIWRYFGWANQTLACITLWCIAACLRRKGRFSLIATLPACFMTCMCTTFLLCARECGIQLPVELATGIGFIVMLVCGGLFLYFIRPGTRKEAA